MNNNKPTVAHSTVTRDVRQLDTTTNNIYESIVVISKRANQVANTMKEELQGKLAEFTSSSDNLEEIFENREQIEVSKQYEQMPKPSLVAIDEFLNGKVYYRNPSKEQN
jgi:DNA-directed RNA polymerase subunit K/omega